MTVDDQQNESIEDLQARIAQLESEAASEVAEETPATPPKKPCGTCNKPTHCANCKQPVTRDGHAPDGTINYIGAE